MNTISYKYSILKYKHSPFLEESLNLGVLIYFLDSKAFSFRYSKNLSRIKTIYDSTPDKIIKEYLRRIDLKLKKIEIDNNLFHEAEVDEFSTFISKNLLPFDGSTLQFGEAKFGCGRTLNKERLEEIIVNKHLIEDIKFASNQPKEPELAQKFYAPFKTIDLGKFKKEKKFFVDYIVRNETGNEFKFDYAWQNGTLNLVKPISFDLKEAKSIAEKAYKNLGQFIDLEDEAEKYKLRYDLIIGRPSSKKLYKEYDHALLLLEKLNHAKIIEESSIDEYSAYAIEAIS